MFKSRDSNGTRFQISNFRFQISNWKIGLVGSLAVFVLAITELCGRAEDTVYQRAAVAADHPLADRKSVV